MTNPTGDALLANEQVELNVARAIYEASPRNKPWSLLTLYSRQQLQSEAKAAIKAYEQAMKGEG